MSDVLVYLFAVGFFLAVFPLHIFHYVYVSTSLEYASVNSSLYRLIRIFNANTVKNSRTKMMINGKERDIKLTAIPPSVKKIFNALYFTKIVQLGDFGLKEEKNGIIALAQNGATRALFLLIAASGTRCKLKNYTVLNYEHGYINYYLKAVTVINLITVSQIIFILLTEKLHERKN